MSARSTTRGGRRKAESLMVDTCTIVDNTGATDNPDGSVTKTATTVYSGKCRVQTYDPYERTPQSPSEVELTIRRDVLQLPMSVERVSTGHIVTITASQLDPSLVGRTFRVTAPSRETHSTMRKIYIEEDTTDG